MPHGHPAARAALLLAPPLAVMGLIFFLSAQPDETPGIEWWQVVLRKIAHVTEYALLSFLWWRALRGLRPQWPARTALAAAAGIGFAYAASDEFHQTFVEGRHGTPVDVLIDSIGISLACLAVLRLHARGRVAASRASRALRRSAQPARGRRR